MLLTFDLTYNCVIKAEEVSKNWMDRLSVTEKERGGVYEMALKWIKFNKICWSGTRQCY